MSGRETHIRDLKDSLEVLSPLGRGVETKNILGLEISMPPHVRSLGDASFGGHIVVYMFQGIGESQHLVQHPRGHAGVYSQGLFIPAPKAAQIAVCPWEHNVANFATTERYQRLDDMNIFRPGKSFESCDFSVEIPVAGTMQPFDGVEGVRTRNLFQGQSCETIREPRTGKLTSVSSNRWCAGWMLTRNTSEKPPDILDPAVCSLSSQKGSTVSDDRL